MVTPIEAIDISTALETAIRDYITHALLGGQAPFDQTVMLHISLLELEAKWKPHLIKDALPGIEVVGIPEIPLHGCP